MRARDGWHAECSCGGMMRWMFRTAVLATLVTACGRSGGPSVESPAQPVEPRLVTSVAGQQWYRARSTCGQGPYEIEVPAIDAKWGQGIDLMLATPRRVAFHAVLIVDGREVMQSDGVYDPTGRVPGKPDNARCVADVKEQLALRANGGAGGPPGTPGTPAQPGTLDAPPRDRPSAGAGLDLEAGVRGGTATLLTFQLPEPVPGARPRIRIRLWSIEPNDLVDVHFGVIQAIRHPNVSEEEYAAHLRWKAEEAEQSRLRLLEQQRLADEEWRRKHPPRVEVAPPVVRTEVVRPPVRVSVETERARAARLEAERAREAQREAERLREIQLEAERTAELEAARRRREAAEAERLLRRQQHCASHPRDTGCWGAGGLEVHLDLERRRRQREEYCAAHAEDARCWTAEDWGKRQTVWNARVQVVRSPPKPNGPPPDPLAEDVPPKLSVHAEWRAGYWEWTSGRWVWLAGMWRVPDEDIVSEQTTTAPAPPPPVRAEAPPPPPATAVIWIPGFWQWSSTSWVWIPGSYQLRPARAEWRAPEWRARGSVHVLIPGGWVQIGGGR